MSIVLQHPRRSTLQGSERRSFGRRVRRVGLAVFFASIGVNAGLGIYAVLAPDFGDTQAKILGTSLCVTGAVLVALACEPAWERKLLGPVPYAGAALGLVGFGLTAAALWVEPGGDTYGRLLGTVYVAAAACTTASLLALARLSKRHEWVFIVTLALLAVGATMSAILLWLGDDPSEAYVRTMGVVLIVLAAFTVSVPVLHWIDRSTLTTSEDATGAVRFCPHCGKELVSEPDVELRCHRCGRGFTITPSAT